MPADKKTSKRPNWARMTKAQLIAELERLHGTDVGQRDISEDHRYDIWQTLVDSIPAPVFYKDTQHVYRGCNSAFEAFLGLPKERIIGFGVYDVAPKELADVYRAADDELFSRGGTQVYEASVKFADGSLRDVVFHKAVFDNADAAVGGLVGAMLDVTDHVRAENALRESEKMVQQLIENIPDSMFVHDQDGRFIQVNESACRSLQYDRDTLLRMNVADVEVGPSPDELKAAWAAMSTEVKRIEGLHRRKDGTTFPVEAHVSRIEKGADGPSAFIAMVRDITEQKAAAERLIVAKQDAEDANRTKTEFLANMSHELRTPLNAILGFSEIIRDETLGPVGTFAYQNYASDIHASGIHLLRIINDMLDLSRLEIDGIRLAENRESVDRMVAESIRMNRGAIGEAGLDIRTDFTDDLPDLICDSRRINQILINLIGNAVKFTPPPGEICIEGRLNADGGIELRVRDTGIGIAEQDLPRLLMPFEQVDNPHTRRHSGSGLGLALSRALAEIHGGALAIESELGVGTSVTVSFPPRRTVQGN